MEPIEKLHEQDGGFFGKDSPHNAAQKLNGPVQTSYRAELRALLHVVRATTVLVMILIDCKAVVNTMQNFLDTGSRGEGKLCEKDVGLHI